MQITDLIRYNHAVRNLYLDAFSKLSWAEFIASRGLSFDSMLGVFLHLTLVEDRWISYVIPGRFKEWVDPDSNTYKDLESSGKYMRTAKENTESYLAKLSTKELNRQIAVPWGNLPGTKISIETGLIHMVMEDMIHYGELSAALWQMGSEAPYLGFWRYKSACR
jgi:uncharacterized damage-inducible protein DinB